MYHQLHLFLYSFIYITYKLKILLVFILCFEPAGGKKNVPFKKKSQVTVLIFKELNKKHFKNLILFKFVKQTLLN